MDTSVRVLVANRPRLMRELVLSTLSEQAGIRVVGEATNEQDVPALVAETKPDFLLIALDESHKRPALCDVLLKEFPALRMKQRLAEDAGRSGQILEEMDLTDAAISDRLRQDLHTRVMATRLLQRYGYLLPKVNPDSDIAAEHNLEMRARVQQLEHAGEAPEAGRAAPQTVITVGSPPAAELSPDRGRAPRQPLGDQGGVLNTMNPESCQRVLKVTLAW